LARDRTDIRELAETADADAAIIIQTDIVNNPRKMSRPSSQRT
jgi:hypothetical protein